MGITPAISDGAIGLAESPMKLMLMAPAPGVVVLTAKVTFVVCARLPLVPVIVSFDVPMGVDPLVTIVMVDVPLPLIVDGEKLAVAPGVGKPPTLKVTVPVN